MVLIEQEPRPASDSTAKDRGAAATADASDGFETASERDVGDNEKNDAQGRLKDQALKQQVILVCEFHFRFYFFFILVN